MVVTASLNSIYSSLYSSNSFFCFLYCALVILPVSYSSFNSSTSLCCWSRLFLTKSKTRACSFLSIPDRFLSIFSIFWAFFIQGLTPFIRAGCILNPASFICLLKRVMAPPASIAGPLEPDIPLNCLILLLTPSKIKPLVDSWKDFNCCLEVSNSFWAISLDFLAASILFLLKEPYTRLLKATKPLPIAPNWF